MNKIVSGFVKTLKEKELTLALAESVTCGMAAHLLATAKGTSDVLTGSVVCYTPEAKNCLLKVPKRQMERYTCESKEVTRTLAKHLAALMEADICAALTGLASEGGSESPQKPVGTVFFAMLYKNKVYDHRQRFYGTPLEIRKKACLRLYELIVEIIRTH